MTDSFFDKYMSNPTKSEYERCKTSPPDNGFNENKFACYCIVHNPECNEILTFLNISGEFTLKMNIETMYEDAMQLLGNESVESANTLLSRIVYPIFNNTFSERFAMLRNQPLHEWSRSKSYRISHEDCVQETHCVTALNALTSMLKKFHNTFSVLQTSTKWKWDRNIGSLVTNLNFLVDLKYERSRHDLKENVVGSRISNSNANIVSVGLQDDLVILLSKILTRQNISLTDMLALLGYGSLIDAPEMLHPLHGFDRKHRKRTECDIDLYLKIWTEYLENSLYLVHNKEEGQHKGINIKYHY